MNQILDACCGSRMFHINKHNPAVTYMDNRQLETILCDGRTLVIQPDFLGDFRDMPFPNDTFNAVIFDPPHLIKAGAKSWLALKYGVLEKDWQYDIRKGFSECFRVLKNNGVLIFKWSEVQIPLKKILALTDQNPLLRERKDKRHWVVFVKEGKI
ncbi:MAG: class I SAM-dependent methyltransferase [Tannerellaceae bacterium]